MLLPHECCLIQVHQALGETVLDLFLGFGGWWCLFGLGFGFLGFFKHKNINLSNILYWLKTYYLPKHFILE